MSGIKEQLLEGTVDAILSTKEIHDTIFRKAALKRFLSSKEVFHVQQDKMDDILNCDPSLLFPDYAEYYANLPEGTEADKNYSDMTDGYNVSEIFGSSRRWRITPDYLKYIKSSNDGFIVNVYDGENTLITADIWKLTNSTAGRAKFAAGKIPQYEFYTPDKVTHAFFGKPTYWDKMYIDSCRSSVAVIAIDIPHSYYANQIMKGNVFTWDIITEKYEVGGMDTDQVNRRIGELAYRGFEKPLVIKIDEGCLTPIDDDTAIDLFLATYLNLPTIPVILYLSDEDTAKNIVLEELHELTHAEWHTPQALDVINNICKPYFFFEMAADAPANMYLTVGGTHLHKNQYPSMNDIDDPSIIVFNRYLDRDKKVEDIIFPMSDDDIIAMKEARALELKDEIQEQVRLENIEINRRILAGEY